MKIRVKLDLYVLKEYLIATLCEKRMLVKVYPEIVRWWLKCGRRRSPKSKVSTG